MPASRSRTQRWRESLEKIHQRGGGLELTLDRGPDAPGGDLVWRVRLLEIGPNSLKVEHPGALGVPFPVKRGSKLIGIMAVGQNRWMFHTEILAISEGSGGSPTLEIAAPQGVERCMRRSFDRIRTASVTLPPVECWALLDPATARAAEIACRTQLLDLQDDDILGRGDWGVDEAPLLPDVGQRFMGELANIGGGGAGLRFSKDHAPALDGRRYFWLRMDLRPVLPAPLAVTARLAHSHLDSAQNVYAGMAFEFQHHAEHKAFVLDQIKRYFELTQRRKAA
ncbi:MAG: hypothetical protein R3B57_07585 [Phycisphaerales bacterium]